MIGIYYSAMAHAFNEPKRSSVGVGGVFHCEVCGTAKCPRRDGEAVRSYWKVVRLILTEGHTCPNCGTFFDHFVVSHSTLRSWKKKFPDLPWDTLRVEIV